MSDILDFILDPEPSRQAFDDADAHGAYDPISDTIPEIGTDAFFHPLSESEEEYEEHED
jgi:hypothetical protein